MPNELSPIEKRKLALEKAGLPTEVVGQDKIRKEDLLLPRIKLCQGSTKEVKEGTAKVGEFIDSITGEVYGSKIEFIPCAHFLQRIKFTAELTLECIAPDILTGSAYGSCAKCNFKEFTTPDGMKKEKGPECNLVYGFLGIIVKDLATKNASIVNACILLSITSTSTPTAKKILSTYKFSKTQINFWERGWTLSSAPQNRGGRNYLILTASPARVLNPTIDADIEIMKIGKELYDWSNTKSIVLESNKPDTDEFDSDSLEDVPVPF